MAKQVSAIRINGTFRDVTFVSSTAYGDHTRAKRGTHKPAPVNSSFKAASKMLLMSNAPAKLVKDAIDPYRGHIAGGTLWRRLVSFFQNQLKEDGKFDFSKLPPFDIHERHPLSRFLTLYITTNAQKNSKLDVEISYEHHPIFKKMNAVDGYQFTLIGIFPDLKKKKAYTTSTASSVLRLKGPIRPVQLQLDLPPKPNEYLICLKLEGCVNEVADTREATIALCIVDAGSMKAQDAKT